MIVVYIQKPTYMFHYGVVECYIYLDAIQCMCYEISCSIYTLLSCINIFLKSCSPPPPPGPTSPPTLACRFVLFSLTVPPGSSCRIACEKFRRSYRGNLVPLAALHPKGPGKSYFAILGNLGRLVICIVVKPSVYPRAWARVVSEETEDTEVNRVW